MVKIRYQKKEISLPSGATAQDLADTLHLNDPSHSLAVLINGLLKDLACPLCDRDEVELLHFDTSQGQEVFWHTSAHVLAQAVVRLWPDALPTIGPPIKDGFYYDFANLTISEEDFPKIEKEIKRILSEKLSLQRHLFKNKKEAMQAFEKNPYKQEIIEEFPKESIITAYRQGDFFDLCRGPHLPHLGKIKAFKLLKTSGAYWRGDSKKTMLTRIYGISFPNREKMQQHLLMLAEIKKRDHRLIGATLDFFSFQEEAPGMPFFHPKGLFIWDSLLDFWKEIHLNNDYQMIKTPQMMTKELWVLSGHWEHYRDNMFTSPVSEEREFAIKPMNCPGCMLYYKKYAHSYRQFPLRIAELGLVHRREFSGALSGLFRVQAFHQDDAHLFMKPDQIQDEVLHVLSLVKSTYQTFGLSYTFDLSTRPKNSIGSDLDWLIGTQSLEKALTIAGVSYRVHPEDGAFYGPKIDLNVHDALGRKWQCGTVQLDMALPKRFGLEYKDSDGVLKQPVMIHRAIFGSIERFFAILIEHFAGKFPLWMSPLPIRVIPVSHTHQPYAKKITQKVFTAGFRSDLDASGESVGKKVRKAQIEQVNYVLMVGDSELANQTVTLRTRNGVVHGEIPIDTFLKKITIEYKERHLVSPYQEGA